ncbi:MAG: PEGA domain-containing protein [Myxococcaceae bacterium]
MRRWVLAALALFVTSAAAAPSKGLAVVEMSAPSSMQGLAAQLTRQVLDAAQAQRMKVVTPDELETFLGPKDVAALKQCGPAAGCLSALLANLPVNRVVVGTLARDQSHYLVHFWLISLTPPTTVAEVDRAILIASRRLQPDVAAALPALLRGEQEAKGTLVLDSTVTEATASLDGEPLGRTPLTRLLKPGKHEVHISHPGYYPVDRLVTVEAGQTTHEVVRLVAVPGTEPLPLPPPETSTPVASGGFRVPVAGWVALGVGVAAGAAGAVLAVSAHDNQDQLLAGYNPAHNTYQGFRSQALSGQNQATWANVCFGIAGAGLITWGVLTWIASSAPAESHTSVGVGVGTHGATLSVAGSF